MLDMIPRHTRTHAQVYKSESYQQSALSPPALDL